MGCCEQLTGIMKGCDASIGGIKTAWIACSNDVQAPTIANDEITKINFTGENPFKEYQFRKETGSATTTFTIDSATGVVFYSTDIVFQFLKQETAKRIEIGALAVGDLVVIVQDNNNKYWYFGEYMPVNASAGDAVTGTAFTDVNGYDITLTDTNFELPKEVTAEAMVAIM